jgi:hypothetical protein
MWRFEVETRSSLLAADRTLSFFPSEEAQPPPFTPAARLSSWADTARHRREQVPVGTFVTSRRLGECVCVFRVVCVCDFSPHHGSCTSTHQHYVHTYESFGSTYIHVRTLMASVQILGIIIQAHVRTSTCLFLHVIANLKHGYTRTHHVLGLQHTQPRTNDG